MRRTLGAALILALLATPAAAAASTPTLRGSHRSMIRQNAIARANDFTFVRSPAQVREWVQKGRLLPLPGNDAYRVDGASFPYARPEIRTFVERLSSQYLSGCGEPLVVTSATRPLDRQPRNASELSVHPAGMAVDLRVSGRHDCRAWLENALLALEGKGVLDVTRERRPPHYHVAVFPQAYAKHVAALLADSARKALQARAAAVSLASPPPAARRAAAHPVESSGGEPAWVDALALILTGAIAIGLARRSQRRSG
ncbi:MAG: hypothetical protein IRZ00_20460 [Gemmatimonadetes bacterium]|nr:hypothetical protein [Gemmatimonadota bacterium]